MLTFHESLQYLKKSGQLFETAFTVGALFYVAGVAAAFALVDTALAQAEPAQKDPSP